MRPRRIRRGERGDRGVGLGGVMLWLQCGHGEFAVENYSAPWEIELNPGSFNAATANSPWRTSARWCHPGAGGPASMRPRRIRRGEQENLSLSRTAHECFNAATANSPWRTGSCAVKVGSVSPLQCGHGEFAVENSLWLTLEAEPAKASMRPRRIRRGEPGWPLHFK